MLTLHTIFDIRFVSCKPFLSFFIRLYRKGQNKGLFVRDVHIHAIKLARLTFEEFELPRFSSLCTVMDISDGEMVIRYLSETPSSNEMFQIRSPSDRKIEPNYAKLPPRFFTA
jgi:hypothetical protein